MTTTDTATTDPRPLLRRVVDQTDRLIAGLRPDQLDLPTPCADWTVRDLVSHLVAVENRIVHIAGGGHPFEVPSMSTDVADDQWYAAWLGNRARVEEALADDRVLDSTFAHPAGEMPGHRALVFYASEFAAHGWDLAAALGVPTVDLDDGAALAILGPLGAALPAEPRGGRVPFGAVVPVPADAPAYDRLVGWLGRDPSWRQDATAVATTR